MTLPDTDPPEIVPLKPSRYRCPTCGHESPTGNYSIYIKESPQINLSGCAACLLRRMRDVIGELPQMEVVREADRGA